MVGYNLSKMFYKTTTVAIVLVVGGMAARADLVTVTGGSPSCAAGTGCPSYTTPVVAPNSTLSTTPFAFTLTAPSTDTYAVTGTTFASYYDGFGTVFQVDVAVTYTGTTGNPSAASVAEDQFKIDDYVNFLDSRSGTWNGTYTDQAGATVTSGLATGSNFSFDVIYDTNQDVGLLGPFTGSTDYAHDSANLTGLGSGNFLDGDYEFSYDIKAGTVVGSSISITAPVPEPRETLPLLLVGLAGFGWYSRKIRKCL